MAYDRRIKPVIERPAPQKALNRLKELTAKAVHFEQAWPGRPAAVELQTEAYKISFDGRSPIAEHQLLHELIHAILFEEGYPCVETGYTMSADLTNALQHPEVFRRMREDFDLDMNVYLSTHWYEETQKTIAAIENEPAGNQRLNYSIYNVYNQFYWHYIGSYAEQGLRDFERLCPQAYRLSLDLWQNAREIGFETPAKAHRVAKAFTEQVHRFCLEVFPEGSVCWANPRIMPVSELLAMQEAEAAKTWEAMMGHPPVA